MNDNDNSRVEELRYAFETLENTAAWLLSAQDNMRKRIAIERDLMGEEAEDLSIDLEQAEILAEAFGTAASNVIGAHNALLGRRL